MCREGFFAWGREEYLVRRGADQRHPLDFVYPLPSPSAFQLQRRRRHSPVLLFLTSPLRPSPYGPVRQPNPRNTLQETAVARERLLSGVAKLTTTNSTVEDMRMQLRMLQPVLADKTVATQRLLEQVTYEQYEAERVRAAVAGEEADVKAQAAKLAALKVGSSEGGRVGGWMSGWRARRR